jgi:hypothetical protein
MAYKVTYFSEEAIWDGTTYTWDGTDTVVATGTIVQVTVGEFIRLESDTSRRFFEVVEIAGQNLIIEDPDVLGIPNSTGAEACCVQRELLQSYPQADSGIWIEECLADPGHTPRLCHVEDAAIGDKVWLSCCPPEVNPHPVAGTLYPKEIINIEVT